MPRGSSSRECRPLRTGNPPARRPLALSSPALASSFPSGLNATPRTTSVWPVRMPTFWPVARCHSRTALSSPALASRRPSGLNATALIPDDITDDVDRLSFRVAAMTCGTNSAAEVLASRTLKVITMIDDQLMYKSCLSVRIPPQEPRDMTEPEVI